jgi:hypothetical protein
MGKANAVEATSRAADKFACLAKAIQNARNKDEKRAAVADFVGWVGSQQSSGEHPVSFSVAYFDVKTRRDIPGNAPVGLLKRDAEEGMLGIRLTELKGDMGNVSGHCYEWTARDMENVWPLLRE